MLEYRAQLSVRLSELDLMLRIVDGSDIAFIEQARYESARGVKLLRREPLGTYDSILALHLAQMMRASGGQAVLISRDEVHGLFSGVLNDVDRDTVTFTARIDAAIARLAGLEILRKTRDDEDSYTDQPGDQRRDDRIGDRRVAAAVRTAAERRCRTGARRTGGSRKMAEQFHLSRLQVINWGVFDGYHDIPFSDGGALIAGASGSGKSSLLDAISLGFLPFNRRNFNASGDNSAAGSNAGRRTVDKYVRGAWGQRSDAGASKVMYLRGDGTAWSAVAVSYTSNTGRTVTGLVLKWLTGESRSDSSSRFVLADGDRDIEDVCNRWAAGRFDSGVFKDDEWRFSTKVESQYLAQLYATIGIRASDAAQQLLGKAKSLKSVGGLEQFVREFMLDEPSSLTRLPEALKQIDPLVEARELLAVAQRKRKILGDIEKIQQRYASESSDLGIIDLVDPPMVRAYTDHVRLAQCAPQIAVAGRHHRPARQRVRGRHPAAQSRQGRRGFTQRADQRIQRQPGTAAVAGGRRRGAGRAGVPAPRRLRVDAERAGHRRPRQRRRVLESA